MAWASLASADSNRLAVTTARSGLELAALAAQPTAGGMFGTTTRRRGVPKHRFRPDVLA